MRRRMLAGLILAGMMATGACASLGARLYIHTGPPAPIYERYEYRDGYVWQPGYYRWDGRDYHWVSGRYVRAPRGRAQWVPGYWIEGRRGWYYVDGHWR